MPVRRRTAHAELPPAATASMAVGSHRNIRSKRLMRVEMRARARASWGLTGRTGTGCWHPTSRRQTGVRAGSFAEPRLGPAAAARSERSLARRVAASTAVNQLVRRHRRVVHVSPRPSVCGGAAIERGIGKLVPLRRSAITSDVVTRLWRRLKAAVAHRPKRIGNEGRCRSNNGSIRPTTQTEARPSWRRTPPARECPSVAVRAAVRS
jgi:hypothetical protein